MKKIFFSALICFLISTPGFSQCDNGSLPGAGDPNCDGSDPDNPAPIDGGVTLLLGLSTLYGIRKFRSSAKEEDI